jgi:hypothetical protein
MRNNLAKTESREGTSMENGQSEVENVAMIRVRSKLCQARHRQCGTVEVVWLRWCARHGGEAVVACVAEEEQLRRHARLRRSQ